MQFREYIETDSSSVFDRHLDEFEPIVTQLDTAFSKLQHPDAREEIGPAIEKLKMLIRKYKGADEGENKFFQPTKSYYAPLA